MSSKLSGDEVRDILADAKNANEHSKRYFLTAQTARAKHKCSHYASQQVTQMKLSHKNKEEIDRVKSISNFIVQDVMVKMTKTIVHSDQSGNY